MEQLTRIQHEPTAPRFRFDPVHERMVEYAVEGRIEFLPSSGNFLLSWNGLDGGRQEMLYEPPNKLSAVVAAEVTFDSQTGLYTYFYTVSNLPSSAQELNTVYIEGFQIEQAFRPDDTWYSRGFTSFLKTTFATDGWVWSRSFSGDGIAPGQTVSGFRFTTGSSPGIVNAYVEGRKPGLQAAAEELPDELHAALNQVYFRLPAGVTVGPAATTAPQTGEAQLDGLLSLIGQAERQGWLGTAASARSVRNSLTAIRAFVFAADTSRAKQHASTLLQNLRTDQYEGMLSEGRALIEFGLPPQLR